MNTSENTLADFEDLDWAALLNRALREDRFESDVTTKACEGFLRQENLYDAQEEIEFSLISRENGVFCGERLIRHLVEFHNWKADLYLNDGDEFRLATPLFKGRAPVVSLLGLERSVLNILQYLSGIATQTSRFQKLLEEAYLDWSLEEKDSFAKPKLYHTRKTLPGLRPYQIYAACVGGAERHRLHLSDRVMLKDNHKFLLALKNKNFVDLVNWAKSGNDPHWTLWLVEVDSPSEAMHMNAIGVKHILLDNFTPKKIKDLLPSLKNVESIEISGGLRLETFKDFVLPGVHRLSVGALTHSARSLDISLELQTPLEGEFVPDEEGLL